MNFALGQRWISDTESDLGLGTIVAIDNRTINVLFTATGDTRVYAIKDAPLTRVMFNVGDTVKSAEGFELLVSEVHEQGNVFSYHGTRTDSHEVVELKEIMLDHFIRFNKPQDRLFAGQIDRFDWFTLRYQNWQHQFKREKSPLRGLLGARASLIPHQLYIANSVGKRFAPRVLLSDEVGLGKTIEAGLIIHQQVQTGRAERVLIVVPENLQHQWLVEMLRRFNLKFAIFDDERCTEAYADAANPFDTEQFIICSLEFLVKKKRWFEQATLAHWDLLVVDEAHHLTWSEDKPSAEYNRIEELSQDIAGLILLTATPDQLGHQSHFARLKLLDSDRFYDYQEFVAEEKGYQAIADAANQLVSNEPLSAEQQATLLALLTDDESPALLAAAQQGDEQAQQTLLSQLLDRHGTGRILFRNTRQGVQGFPERQLLPIPVDMPKQYQTAKAVMGNLGQSGVDKTALRNLFPEQIYVEFDGGQVTWTKFDPRVDALIELLKTHRREKVLVICAHAQTALNLEQALMEREGIRAAVFHEGMSIFERDKAAAYFAQEDYSAQVLLCSEIGSEGRNFQFASHLVLFDLPLNPDLLEQRIGRLDRIGQQQTVKIHVPYFIGSAQEVLFRWYHEGLNAFELTCNTGQVIYQQFAETLLNTLAYGADEDDIEQLIADTGTRQQQLKKQLEQGRDRLLELHSCGQPIADQLVADISAIDDQPQLAGFMLKVFDLYGINQEDKGDNAIILTPAENMIAGFPGLDDDGTSVTFDRATALAHEDVQFLSWDHPMFTGAMDWIMTNELGSSSVAILANKALPAGNYFVELVYIAETSAAKNLQMGRFMPATPIRVLLDQNGNNLAPKVAFDGFNRQLSPIGRQTASKLVNALQPQIHQLIGKADALATEQLAKLQSQASDAIRQQCGEELTRLAALKAVNPNIRQDELDFQSEQQQTLLTALDNAQLKLDAIRLIVVSHN